jgi:RimJ/RimL family protein N-acetyltransferase
MRGLPFPDPPLDDGVVALRPWGAQDVPLMDEWLDGSWLEQAVRDGRTLPLAIVDAATGAVLGSCDIRRPEPDDPDRGEIGYLLVPEARGRGAATRAMALLVGWAFRELGMRRVQALVHPDNPASMAVLERLGFQREGLLRSYRPPGEDRIMFAITAAPPRTPAPPPGPGP